MYLTFQDIGRPMVWVLRLIFLDFKAQTQILCTRASQTPSAEPWKSSDTPQLRYIWLGKKKKLWDPYSILGFAIVLSSMVQLDLEYVSANLLFTLAKWTLKCECKTSSTPWTPTPAPIHLPPLLLFPLRARKILALNLMFCPNSSKLPQQWSRL